MGILLEKIELERIKYMLLNKIELEKNSETTHAKQKKNHKIFKNKM